MLVKERMSHPVIFVEPDLAVQDAVQMMRRENIRRMPVVKDGKLVGIVSETDLLNASPSQATSLSIWELNYLLSKVTVNEVMSKDVITINGDIPIEEAARICADNKIGGLPVVDGDSVMGIITETDLFRVFLELFGARDLGTRITVMMEDKPGVMAKVAGAIGDAGGNIIAAGTFSGEDQTSREVVFKVTGLDEAKVKEVVTPVVKKVVDIRQCCS